MSDPDFPIPVHSWSRDEIKSIVDSLIPPFPSVKDWSEEEIVRIVIAHLPPIPSVKSWTKEEILDLIRANQKPDLVFKESTIFYLQINEPHVITVYNSSQSLFRSDPQDVDTNGSAKVKLNGPCSFSLFGYLFHWDGQVCKPTTSGLYFSSFTSYSIVSVWLPEVILNAINSFFQSKIHPNCSPVFK